MRHLTIRNIPEDLARALEVERRRRGLSLTQTVKDLLRHSLSVGTGVRASNGLARLAGTWSAEELAEFEAATDVFEQVDPELWK